jgi:hypothetical protein
MDQKLLDALNNIGLALEELVDALNSKNEAKSDTATAIQSGDFSEDLKSISEGIKSIKADTQTIIKNQQTIIAQGKDKESAKTKDIETDPKKESDIKKGVGTILLIAVAVLAIGMAFKLVGNVDFLSVVGLALGITIISIAFEKVAKLGLGLKEAAITSAIMVMMAAAVTASSWILSAIKPLTLMQAATGVLIGAMFYFLVPAAASMLKAMESETEVEFGGTKIKTKGINISSVLAGSFALPLIMIGISVGITTSSFILSAIKPIGITQALTAVVIGFVFSLLAPVVSSIITGLTSDEETSIPGIGKIKKKGVSMESAMVAAFAIPIIMMGMSLAITTSSYILGLVKPVGFMQLLTTIAIAAVFTVLAYGLSKIVSALGDLNPAKAIAAAIIIPIIFVAMSYAMMKSSEYFAGIQTISFGQFLTSLTISIIFVVLSFAVKLISKALGDLSPEKALVISAISVGLFVALSYAMMISSEYLSKVTPVDYGLLFNIVVMTIAITLSTVVFALGIWVLSKLGFTTPAGAVKFLIGAGLTLVVAATIMLSSLLLGLGKYEKYPSVDWTLGVGASFLVFTVSLVALGAIAMTGVGAAAFFLGIPMVLSMSKTIVEVSKMLTKGDYNLPGFLDWAKAVSLLFITFTPIILILAAVGLASSVLKFLGVNPFKKANKMILEIAETIVDVSNILPKGNYKGGPTKEWAEGISIALAAFSPVFEVLTGQSWLSKSVSVKDMKKAILTISEGIVDAAIFFADAKNAGVWGAHPTKEWAEGVGTAIGAFAPVFEVLTGQSWLSKSVSPEDMKKAILTISEGIVSAAIFFADNTATFEEGKYPSWDWGEGVGAALGAFAPVFDMLMEKSGFWKSGDSVIRDMIKGITGISSAIVQVAALFELASSSNMFDKYPDIKWSDGVRKTIESFVDLSNHLDKNKKSPYWRAIDVSKRIVKMSEILHGGSNFFSNNIDPNYIKNVSQNMLDFNELVKKLSDSEGDGFLKRMGRMGENLIGTDPIMQIAKRMITLAEGYDKLATSLIKLGTAMRTLNISDIRMLGGLTREITKSSNIRSDISQQEPGDIFASKSISDVAGGLSNIFDKKDKQTGQKIIEDKMDEVIRLLTNIDNSAQSINTFMMENSDSAINGPPSAGNKLLKSLGYNI